MSQNTSQTGATNYGEGNRGRENTARFTSHCSLRSFRSSATAAAAMYGRSLPLTNALMFALNSSAGLFWKSFPG
jgi:hypothetical protein